MASLLSNLFLGRRRSGLVGLVDRRRHGGIANAVNTHRQASLLTTILTLAIPLVIRRLMVRRERAMTA